jgi:hypothetical protein
MYFSGLPSSYSALEMTLAVSPANVTLAGPLAAIGAVGRPAGEIGEALVAGVVAEARIHTRLVVVADVRGHTSELVALEAAARDEWNTPYARSPWFDASPPRSDCR